MFVRCISPAYRSLRLVMEATRSNSGNASLLYVEAVYHLMNVFCNLHPNLAKLGQYMVDLALTTIIHDCPLKGVVIYNGIGTEKHGRICGGG